MPEGTIDELRRVRPDLAEPFAAAFPGARATVLGRLWGALAREPLPGVTVRQRVAAGTNLRSRASQSGWQRSTSAGSLWAP